MHGRIVGALQAVHLNNAEAGHPLGRPYLSSYQIAIALDETDPDLCSALGKSLGGAGTGEHHSLAQYIGNQLSRRIASEEITDVEGVWMSNERVRSLVYRGRDGDISSSLPGTPWDMALFRWAGPPA